MKKVLFICDYIPPEHSATGRLTYFLAKGLSNSCEVHLVTLSTNEDRNDVVNNFRTYRLLNRYGKYQKLVRDSENKNGFVKLLYKIAYRIYYFVISKKGFQNVSEHKRLIQKMCYKIIKNHNIDTIVSISNPFANQEIAYEIVKHNPQIVWFPYLMDSNRNNVAYLGDREFEMKCFLLAEKVLVVPALLHDREFIEDFSDKIQCLDMPIIPVKKENSVDRKDANITFVYAGKFYEEIRNPKQLFEVFLRLPSNYILKIFYGGCSHIVQEYKEKLGDRLLVSGYIPPEELDRVVLDSNIVINIGNTVVNQVPSKVYDLIAYGKPILNFYQREDDISIDDIEKYSLCKSISYTNCDIKEIQDWCDMNKCACLSYEEATCNLKEKRLDSCVKELEEIVCFPKSNLQ